LLFFCANYFFSQVYFVRNDSIKVFLGPQELLNPWAGGFNSTQFSSLDIDLDGKKDIVAFDKGSFKIKCFQNTGSANYTRYKHAPQFESKFPSATDFILFKDYNADGKEDIFTYSSGGMKIFKNTSTLSTGLQFTLSCNLLYSNYNPLGIPQWYNLYCSPVGIPGLGDVDNDGDLDILTFSVFGTEVEYHQNQAVEQGKPLDSLVFFMVDQCWGNFDEGSCTANLNSCPIFKKMQMANGGYKNSNLHAGSCLNCFDNDGDGDLDLLQGDIACDSLEFYYNTGTLNNAQVDSATKKYPSQKPVKMGYYPCSYFLDTDNDGARDLLVSPNTTPSAENFQSVWRYKNVGTDISPIFNYVESNFLQDSMIDVGEGAYPALFDEDGDGLLDIVIGNLGYYNNPTYQSKMALLKNTGTVALPQFTIVNRNYANLNSYLIQEMSPAFGDLDNDGDKDLIIGDYNGKLTYFNNTAGVGVTANFVLVASFFDSIDAGSSARPQIIDVNRDGKNDLVVGGKNGKVYYYPNIGTTTLPNFSKISVGNTSANLLLNSWGGVNVSHLSITGCAAPCLMDVNGSYELLVGSERGWIYRFGNIDGNLSGTFTLIDSIGWNLWEGNKVAPCVGNIDNDNLPDMILGNYDGGLTYLQGDSLLSGIKTFSSENNISLYPNPATNEITISFSSKDFNWREIEIFDIAGRSLKFLKSNQPVIKINTTTLSEGLYILRYGAKKNEKGSVKFIIGK
jgi:hypothetical protein